MRRAVLSIAAGALLLASGAHAAITLSSIDSTIDVSVRAPPVSFLLGAGANKERYFSEISLTPNGTSFAAGITGRLGADILVKDVVRLTNSASGDRTVTLRGVQVTNVYVPIHSWTVRSGGSTTVATMDMRASDPTATFNLPQGATYELDMRVKVLRGVAANEATFTSSVWAVIG